ncbi:hypothetical protein N7447_006680 [Penicillium robsamsonii]|uniref:uncharacterized protein n=1 Tax=Penicillium robsamsonii TaxID=1792511 RepID=UPI002549852E|nr:uncharacterized protein N7447_006680 [Penicillium robsamsonii]KAJ5824340.1 hypothetical protein N7447_006680 [Penicillium robsamsonii]
MEILVQKLAKHPICGSAVFGEMWRTRTKAQMISPSKKFWTTGALNGLQWQATRSIRHSLAALYKREPSCLIISGNAQLSPVRLHAYGRRRHYYQQTPRAAHWASEQEAHKR